MASKTTVLKRRDRRRSVRSAVRAAPRHYRKATKRRIRQSQPLPKRLVLHPTSLFLILCSGVFICGWTYRVVADTVISSVIEAPPLHSPATITVPDNGAVVSNLPLDVSGSCPTNSYVVLSLNGSFDGVAWCGQDNMYTIETALFSGLNNLTVQDYNQTDLAGPSSSGIQVRYMPPAAPSSSPGQTSGKATVSSPPSSTPKAAPAPSQAAPSSQSNPILLISNFKFKTFTAQKSFSWPLDLEGGTPPYKVHVNWGDNQTSNLYFPTDPTFIIKHVFQSAGYYTVTVNSTDATGQTMVMQLAALIDNTNGKAPFITPITSSTAGKTTGHVGLISKKAADWLLVIWPSYIVVALMAISFWLGERREYRQLLLRHARHKPLRRATPAR